MNFGGGNHEGHVLWPSTTFSQDTACTTKTCLFKYIENFTSKNWNFSDKKKNDIFHISAQNIDCGYLLEPPHWDSSNEYQQSLSLSLSRASVQWCTGWSESSLDGKVHFPVATQTISEQITLFLSEIYQRNVRKCAFRLVRPAKIRICAVWPESWLSAFWIIKDAKFLCAENEDWTDCMDAHVGLSFR